MSSKKAFTLSSLDIHFAAQELQSLIGCRVNRIYSVEKTLILVFSTKNEGKRILSINLPENICFLQQKEDMPEMPGGNTFVLRKHLEGSLLKDIEQEGFDRILKFSFFSKEQIILVVELFSHGNWFLLDKKSIILGTMKEETWKDRTLKRGLAYVPPKPAVNTLLLSLEQIHTIITASTMDSIVKAFAINLSIGGVYAEELCTRSGLDKLLAVKDFSKKDAFMTHSSLRQMTLESPRGFAYADVVTPLPLLSRQDALVQELPSFLEARSLAIRKKVTKTEQELERQKIVLTAQEHSLQEAEQQMSDNAHKGEWVYEHYQAISDMLAAVKSASKSQKMMQTIQDILIKHHLEGAFDQATGIVTLTVDKQKDDAPEAPEE